MYYEEEELGIKKNLKKLDYVNFPPCIRLLLKQVVTLSIENMSRESHWKVDWNEKYFNNVYFFSLYTEAAGIRGHSFNRYKNKQIIFDFTKEIYIF